MTKRRAMTKARRKRVLDTYGHACGQCSSEEGAFEIDHIHALGLGGEDTDDNLWPLCIPCHKAKTGGTGRGTSYGSDKHAIAKAKRINRKREDRKRAVKSWQSRPLTHPTLRRKVNGTVERRT